MPRYSKYKVLIQCDYCGSICEKSLHYCFGICACNSSKCINKKREDICMKKYGVKNTFQSLEKKEKIKQTNLQRYNVCNPLQSKKIRKKVEQTNLKKYGVVNVFSSIQIQNKIRQKLYENNTVPTSKPQLFLYNILKEYEINKNNIQLNYPLYSFSLDIALINEKIDIEYNGGGHNLHIKLKNLTQSAFDQREIRRNSIIVRNNWKQIIIISNTDKWYYHNKFTKEQILKLIYIAKMYLLNTNHHWVKIYIEENKFKTNVYTQTITNILNI